MADEIKKDEEGAEKTLVDEIAALDLTGDDTPLDVSTDEEKDESKTVDEEEKKDETVDDDKKSVDESKEGSSDEKKTEEDTKTPEEKKVEVVSEKDKDKKSEEEGEPKKEVSQIDKLLTEIDRLSGPKISEKVPKEEKETPKEEKADELISDKDSIYDFVKDLDMDDVSADPKVFNEILHKVVARVQQLTTEQVLRSIPEVVMSQVRQQTYFKKMADDFYKDNKDLVNVKQVVRACAQQLQKTNPEWEIEKVFSEAATKTRETLGMSAHVIEKEEELPSEDDAAFAKQKGGSKSNLKQKRSSLQTEIDEL